MGLLTIIKKQKLKDKSLRVLLLGLDNAGKTTIVKNLIGEDPNKVSPTMGFTIYTHMINAYALDIWDIGGQKSLRPFWQNYFDKTDSLVWVLDALSFGDRLDQVKAELHSTLQQDTLKGTSLVLIINKIDLAPTDGVIEALELETLGLHDVHIRGVCGLKDREAVAECFEWIVKEAKQRGL